MKIQRIFLPFLTGLGLIAVLILAVGWQADRVFARERDETGIASQRSWMSDLTSALNEEGTDLAVGKWADRQQVMPGGVLTFTVVVTNIGPLTGTMIVTLTDHMSPSLAVAGMVVPGEICQVDPTERLISCTWSMPAGVPPISYAIPIVITSSEAYSGRLFNTATVTGSLADPNLDNNTAVAVISIQEAMQVYMPLIRRAVIPPTLPPPIPMTGTLPIDFEIIREQLQANGQDLAFVKVGFHVGFGITPTVHPVYTYMAELDAGGVPFFLKTVDNAEPVFIAQEMMRSSGVSHTLIYRKSGLGYDWPDYSLSPQLAAQGHWQRHRTAFPPELDPNLVWIETVNEVDKGRAEWLGEFALETAQLALADGFRWAAFGWASGEPEREHWETPSMLEFLRLAGRYPDRLAIALHEYSYTVGDIARQYPYLVGRVQALFDVCDRNWIPRPTVLISEWGWEYQNVPPVLEAMEDIAWASWLYAAYPQIQGAAIWFLGTGEEWGDIRYQVAELLEPMSIYARSSYFIIEQGWGAIDPELFRPASRLMPR